MKKVEDIVVLFKDESGKVVGMMVQNGATEFYRCTRATKEFVKNELLELNQQV